MEKELAELYEKLAGAESAAVLTAVLIPVRDVLVPIIDNREELKKSVKRLEETCNISKSDKDKIYIAKFQKAALEIEETLARGDDCYLCKSCEIRCWDYSNEHRKGYLCFFCDNCKPSCTEKPETEGLPLDCPGFTLVDGVCSIAYEKHMSDMKRALAMLQAYAKEEHGIEIQLIC